MMSLIFVQSFRSQLHVRHYHRGPKVKRAQRQWFGQPQHEYLAVSGLNHSWSEAGRIRPAPSLFFLLRCLFFAVFENTLGKRIVKVNLCVFG